MIYGQYANAARAEGVYAGFPAEGVFVGSELVVINTEPELLLADKVMVEAVTVPNVQVLTRICAYLDGSGDADAAQVVRPVLYREGRLVATGPPVAVPPDAAPRWWSLPCDPPGDRIGPGDYEFGIQSGPTSEGARFYLADVPGSLTTHDAPWAAGPPKVLAGGSVTAVPMMFYMETLRGIVVADTATDDYLASLPFGVAQRIFGASAPLRRSPLPARAGWYGTKFDPARGANGIIRSGGAFADLVGERLKVTTTGPKRRSVYIYVHDERDFPAELTGQDILLSARAFAALGNPTRDYLRVIVEVLA